MSAATATATPTTTRVVRSLRGASAAGGPDDEPGPCPPVEVLVGRDEAGRTRPPPGVEPSPSPSPSPSTGVVRRGRSRRRRATLAANSASSSSSSPTSSRALNASSASPNSSASAKSLSAQSPTLDRKRGAEVPEAPPLGALPPLFGPSVTSESARMIGISPVGGSVQWGRSIGPLASVPPPPAGASSAGPSSAMPASSSRKARSSLPASSSPSTISATMSPSWSSSRSAPGAPGSPSSGAVGRGKRPAGRTAGSGRAGTSPNRSLSSPIRRATWPPSRAARASSAPRMRTPSLAAGRAGRCSSSGSSCSPPSLNVSPHLSRSHVGPTVLLNRSRSVADRPVAWRTAQG